jgi:hypothetical protein
MLAAGTMASLTGLGMMEIRVMMLDVGFVAGCAQLVVVDHFRVCNLGNTGPHLGKLPLLPVSRGLNPVRRGGRWINRLPAKSGRRARRPTRDRIQENDTNQPEGNRPPEIAPLFIGGREHGINPETRSECTATRVTWPVEEDCSASTPHGACKNVIPLSIKTAIKLSPQMTKI